MMKLGDVSTKVQKLPPAPSHDDDDEDGDDDDDDDDENDDDFDFDGDDDDDLIYRLRLHTRDSILIILYTVDSRSNVFQGT
jgi:hypothetical protein